MGPEENGDAAGADALPGFLELSAALVGAAVCFLETFELPACGEDFLVLEATAVFFCAGDFFFPLRRVGDALLDFSGGGLCSFSVFFSSLGGAADQEQNPMFLKSQHNLH